MKFCVLLEIGTSNNGDKGNVVIKENLLKTGQGKGAERVDLEFMTNLHFDQLLCDLYGTE